MKVEILRCWKSNINNTVQGEYYVMDGGNKELVLQNGSDIRVFGHFLDESISDCIRRPTKEVIEAVTMASTEYLLNR